MVPDVVNKNKFKDLLNEIQDDFVFMFKISFNTDKYGYKSKVEIIDTKILDFIEEELFKMILEDIKREYIQSIDELVYIYSKIDYNLSETTRDFFIKHRSVKDSNSSGHLYSKALNDQFFEMCCAFKEFHAFCLISLATGYIVDPSKYFTDAIDIYNAKQLKMYMNYYKDANNMENFLKEVKSTIKYLSVGKCLENFLVDTYYKSNQKEVYQIHKTILKDAYKRVGLTPLEIAQLKNTKIQLVPDQGIEVFRF